MERTNLCFSAKAGTLCLMALSAVDRPETPAFAGDRGGAA